LKHILHTKSIPLTFFLGVTHLIGRLDIDPLGAFPICQLWNHDAQDTLAEVGLDAILVNAAGEAETAVELANRTLRNPQLGFGRVGLGYFFASSAGDNSCAVAGFRGILIFDIWLAVLLLCVRVFNLLILFAAFVAFNTRIGTAFDDERVWVVELDLNVLLINTGKLAVKVVGVLLFFDVEPR